MPTIYVAENHPLVTGHQPYRSLGARVFVGYMKTDPESMRLYLEYEKGLKCPSGKPTVWDSNGLLRLRPGDYLFLRDVGVSEDPSDDVLAVLVTGQLHHSPAQIVAYDHATQTMLGPASQRTPDSTAFEATGCPKKIRGKRCYQGGTAVQQSRRVVAPAASLEQSRANMDVYQGMVSGLVNATADMLLNVQSVFPQSYLNAFKANSDLTGQPAIGNAHVLGTSSVQFNISAAGLSATDNRLGSQLGDSGCEHYDGNDSPDHFTTMFSNPDIPSGYDHGAFHLLQLGVYVITEKYVGISFSGRRLHVGTAPTPPQGVVGVPWAYRNNTVWYAKLAAVDGRSRFTLASLPTKTSADSEHSRGGKSGTLVRGKGKQVRVRGKGAKERHSEVGEKKGKGDVKGRGKKGKVTAKPEPIYLTPEMINMSDEGFVPPTSNRATFARSGHVIMNRESQMNFMGRSLHLLNSYVYRQLPVSFGIRIDVKTLLSAITYLNEGGDRVALLDWPSAPNVGEISTTRKSDHTTWRSFQAKVRRFIPHVATRGFQLVDEGDDDDDDDDEWSDDDDEWNDGDGDGSDGSDDHLGIGEASSPDVGIVPSSSVEGSFNRSFSSMQGSHGINLLSNLHAANPVPSNSQPMPMVFSHVEIPCMPSNLKAAYEAKTTSATPIVSSSSASSSELLDLNSQSLVGGCHSSPHSTVTHAETSRGVMRCQTSVEPTEISPMPEVPFAHSSHGGASLGRPAGERMRSSRGGAVVLASDSRSESPELPIVPPSNLKRRVHESPPGNGSGKRLRSSSVKHEEQSCLGPRDLQAGAYPFVEKLTTDVLWKENSLLSSELEHAKGRLDESHSFNLPQLLAAYRGATKNPLTLDYMRALVSQVRRHEAYDALHALQLRMERYSVILSSIHMWYWLDVTIRQNIRDIFDQPSGTSNALWLSASVDVAVFALRWQHESVRFDPTMNPGLQALLSGPSDIPNRHKRKKFLSTVQSDRLLLIEAVTQTVQGMLMIALDFPKDGSMWERKRAWVMGTIADSIGPEFLATRYAWDAYSGFTIRDYISDPQAYRSVNSDLVQPFKSALQTHPITSFDSNERWLYQSFVRDLEEHCQTVAPLMAAPPVTLPQSPSGASPFPGFDVFVQMSLLYLGGKLSFNDQLSQYLRGEPDFRLPFRERAPLRLRFCSDSGPYTSSIIRTNAGIFSAIVFRGITYNTAFSNHPNSPMVFLDAEDWRARLAVFKQTHPESQRDPQYFCKRHAYGQSISTREVANADGFWKAVLDLDWPAQVARPMTFHRCLSLVTKANLRGMGSLCNYLLACDLHYAGICDAPTCADIAGAMMSIRGGSYTALSTLGIIPAGTKPTRQQIESAIDFLDLHIRTFFTDEARDAMGWDLICLEHSLCKFSRALQNKVALSM